MWVYNISSAMLADAGKQVWDEMRIQLKYIGETLLLIKLHIEYPKALQSYL